MQKEIFLRENALIQCCVSGMFNTSKWKYWVAAEYSGLRSREVWDGILIVDTVHI